MKRAIILLSILTIVGLTFMSGILSDIFPKSDSEPETVFLSTDHIEQCLEKPTYAKTSDYRFWVADLIWHDTAIIGKGGPFPATDTLILIVEDAGSGVWSIEEPSVEDFNDWAKPPAYGYTCVEIREKRLWHYK
ncbi:MAG: hypothetical protein MI974_31915 [Chitinophagales bacterium]|nr:hypothetical protein [Chitinophagales bacterium]